MGGSPGARSAWIPAPAGQAYWPSSAVIDSAGRLQVFLMHVRYNPFAVFGFKIATFSLPSLSLHGISSQLPFTDSTHPYGTTAARRQRLRVPLLHERPEPARRTGSAGLGHQRGRLRVLDRERRGRPARVRPPRCQFANVPTPVVGINLHAPIAGLWVVPHGAGYLGTAKLVNQFSNDVSLFTAPAPEGPWTYAAPAATTPSGVFTYGAQTVFALQGCPAPPRRSSAPTSPAPPRTSPSTAPGS